MLFRGKVFALGSAEPRRKKAERRQAKVDQRQRIQGRDEQLLVAGVEDETPES